MTTGSAPTFAAHPEDVRSHADSGPDRAATPETSEGGVLRGVTVIELSIAIAGPSCCRTLAYHGADVIKIESRSHPDVTRLFGSAWAQDLPADVAMDTSPYLGELNAGKSSVGLELKHPQARAALLELIDRADIFVTNYSAPAVRTLGLTGEELTARRPALIYIGLPGFGSDPATPYYDFLAWGPNQAPLVGLDALTGFADQEPAGTPAVALPDYFAGLHALIAVLTAIEHRHRTGEGSIVDVSQFETSVSALGPLLVNQQLGGPAPQRAGNRLPWLAPQGCYPCHGDDTWLAVTVEDDRSWAALAIEIGPPATDPRYAAVTGRQQHHDEIDEIVSRWTLTKTASDAARILQDLNVAACEVFDSPHLVADEHLRQRRWFQTLASTRFPDGDLFSGHPIQLPDSPGHWGRAAPSMGEDTRRVLVDLAGLTHPEVDNLVAVGAAFEQAEASTTLRRPRSLPADAEPPVS